MLSLCKSAPKTTTATETTFVAAATTADAAPRSDKIVLVPRERLFVSEPDPRMFGNDSNPPKGQRTGWNNENWLKSRFHFSFAEYNHGPSNFGVLRVMNDDLVQPKRGFGTHPHRDMEIITYIVDGKLTHKDSMGTEETIGRGSIQFMTAGTGIRHSEHNLEPSTPLRFVQMWVTPRKRGLRPNYGSMIGDQAAAERRKNQWAQVVSDAAGKVKADVQINQDCNMFVTELSPGSAAPPFNIQDGRQVYMLCLEGSASMGGQEIRRHDAAKIDGGLSLDLLAGQEGAYVLLVEMARG
eukprot:gnl/TRDRNA2_/TRDRNA2_35445_c0_seq1.p1 gnl/TRDRNA2_/TRDRNA2_35445_c0~~gnl/TRDRNA2_/TRDRNA2_35445_c0_seq1.p1  ORF type:complete len:296 (-),score=47.03 gnl/TRDRNA2_/TRDRNA2_35445_c0_seq1:124-1011(-)